MGIETCVSTEDGLPHARCAWEVRQCNCRTSIRLAADWANRALETDVTDAELHRLFAEAMEGGHNYLGAIEAYRAAIELDPEAPLPRFALARAYLEVGKPREARRVLDDLLRLDPAHPGARALLEDLKENDEP